ncbi:hypothetical protein [Clavibacter michiganensis]|uniref:hypothetical protein n=1 Tax=Clavibacter michiganensis TaxID=28447 RepID=UPI001BE10BB5|nr:hypothetical protein [Clavibacter michiganensis]MBT1636581.1 hypothetical protein [Clavibacter michiganensis]
MQLYSALPLVRARQIAADTAALAGIVVSVLLGIAVAALIRPLGDLGRSMEQAGTRLGTAMSDAADSLGGLPLVGDAARGPFEDASGIGAGLEQAGRDQQSLVGTVALLLGLLVALVPIAFIVRHWLLRRISFVRRASAARSLASTPGGTELLALRALSSRKPASLLKAHPDPVAAWRAGDPRVVRQLADLALRDAGVSAGR